MAIHPYFGETRPNNSLENYQNYVFVHPKLRGCFPDQNDIDACDSRLLQETHRCFQEILSFEPLCLIWAYAFARVVPREGIYVKKDESIGWEDKRESLMVLVKKSVDLLTKREEGFVLENMQRVCRVSALFFRRFNGSLSFLWRDMSSLSEGELHPFQKAPCLEDVYRLRFEDWPLHHFASFGNAYTIFRGITSEASLALDKELGIVPKRSFSQNLALQDWRRIWSSVQENMSYFYGGSSENIQHCVSFPPSESPDKWGVSVIDFQNTAVTVNLIRTGIYPFTIVDCSFTTGIRITEWREEVQSTLHVPLFHIACQFSRREIVEALMEDRESFREYYKHPNRRDTPYTRAVSNEKYPSVLIPLLEEVKTDPEGGLAQEMEMFARIKIAPDWMPTCLANALAGRAWRLLFCNRLFLGCVSGDMEWVRYLIKEKEENARRACGEGATEEAKCLAAAASCSYFVNRTCEFGGPRGTPADVAVKNGHPEIALFLCRKGAKVSVDVQLAATGQIREQIDNVLGRWDKEQKEILQELNLQGVQINLTRDRIDELVATQVSYKNKLKALQKEEREYTDLNERFQQGLDKFEAILQRLQRSQRLKEQASKTVVHHFFPIPSVHQEVYAY